MEKPQSLSSLKAEYKKAKTEYKQAKSKLKELNREETRLECGIADLETVLGFLNNYAKISKDIIS